MKPPITIILASFIAFLFGSGNYLHGQENIDILNAFECISAPKTGYDTANFNRCWSNIVAFDTCIVDFLINNSDSIDGKYYHSVKKNIKVPIGFFYPRVSYFHATFEHCNRLIYAEYLITALYYNNYFFASDKYLYRKNKIPNMDSLSFWERTKLDENAINDVWTSILEWRKITSGLTLPEIRAKGLHPLEKSGCIWLGEQGCKINSNFDHTPIYVDTTNVVDFW